MTARGGRFKGFNVRGDARVQAAQSAGGVEDGGDLAASSNGGPSWSNEGKNVCDRERLQPR